MSYTLSTKNIAIHCLTLQSKQKRKGDFRPPSSGLLVFDVGFDEVEFFKDRADMVNPIQAVDITHLEVMVCLEDGFSGCSIIQVVSVDSAFDIVIDFSVIFFTQPNQCVCRDIEEDCVVWCL